MNSIGNHTVVSENSTLLVLRHSNNSVGIVKNVNEQGNLIDIQPDKSGIDTTLSVDSSAVSFLDFYTNFYYQLKNPADYSFFKVKEYEARETAIGLQKYLESSSDSEKRDLNEYAVSIKRVEAIRNQTKAGKDCFRVNNSFHQKSSEINSFQYRFQMEDVPWERLAEIGLDRDKLERLGVLDSLLKGYKTDKVIALSLKNGKSAVKTDARLQLRLNNDGEVVVCIHRVKDKPNFDELFFGHRLSKEDEFNLLKSGNLGRVVELLDKITGELIPSLISLDRLTNELFYLRLDFVRIPVVVCGVQLNREQQRILKDGKPLFVEGMISKNGKELSANLQFNAEMQCVEFLFEDDLKSSASNISKDKVLVEIPKLFRGKRLFGWQMKKLESGEWAYIKGLVSKGGKNYQGYISFDELSKRIVFSFKNPKRV
ncbi:DUF3945 domain-containing protein [Epilithonimonas sp.]|uniref:DUF3945 domain-containing protein n=1 Tax=Epilithonimonas sp. TaxID=2894511 RepID=UPI00289D8F35|nr:DUF3945 domain-containing protein [Epilithonimonas sp.]